ncbi:unnamed protein product [Toxocara canis]|uniref:PKD_channel domain-containing protein n=1 Tax=Toxocara canis TaxID=6265 RepID=A0A183UKC2_TOXCA|nr:unnamed protein product [Toxocara canis]
MGSMGSFSDSQLLGSDGGSGQQMDQVSRWIRSYKNLIRSDSKQHLQLFNSYEILYALRISVYLLFLAATIEFSCKTSNDGNKGYT